MADQLVGELTVQGTRLSFYRRLHQNGTAANVVLKIKKGWLKKRFELTPTEAGEIISLTNLALHGARTEE